MFIYNTLTRKKEEFKPLNPPNVRMYVCGPTVYDYFHIGNGRTFIMSDIMRRYLEYAGYKVTFVMNLTDIDDKIIKKSNEENIPSSAVAEKYINAFMEDLNKLKIKKADIYPKATENITDIIDMIKKLEEKGAAYSAEGDVFYNVSSFKDYGKLSGKKTDELESGARIEVNDLKKNPLDFALWKNAKPGEPSWESPWGKGRPGWHIECSAMSCKHLGETIDIHAGGNDLIFPHHENEIAQSEAANGAEFVKYWIHFGFLNIKEEKMSKSLGNFFTAREIVKKYPAEVLRLLFLQTHYAGPLNYSDELMESAGKGYEKIRNLVSRLKEKISVSPEGEDKSGFDFESFLNKFKAAMDDDFNTPKAVASVFDYAKEINAFIDKGDNLPKGFFENALKTLSVTADDVLGIISKDEEIKQGDNKLLEDVINLVLEIRSDAKKNKNYSLADQIRDRLTGLGVIIRDSREGTTFKLK